MTTYPIAETFTNIQGEGTYAGTWMFFIRLAGCNVGKFEKPSEMDDLKLGQLRVFNSNHSICTTATGEKLLCDTDYQRRFEFSVEELLAQREVSGAEHICITGGEPFLHNLRPLIDALWNRQVHIETSGTLPVSNFRPRDVWITCSPKVGFDEKLIRTNEVNEWKFLVGEKDIEELIRDFEKADTHERPIFIQPIGDIHTHLPENMTRCIELLKRNPRWKLSAQLHKYVGGR